MIEADFHPEVTMEELSDLVSHAPIQETWGRRNTFSTPLSDEESAPIIQGLLILFHQMEVK